MFAGWVVNNQTTDKSLIPSIFLVVIGALIAGVSYNCSCISTIPLILNGLATNT